MEKEPNLPSPMIDPQQVADAILEASVKPTRDLRVGVTSRVNTFTAKNLPGLADRMAARREANSSATSRPSATAKALLHIPGEHIPGESGRVHGHHPA